MEEAAGGVAAGAALLCTAQSARGRARLAGVCFFGFGSVWQELGPGLPASQTNAEERPGAAPMGAAHASVCGVWEGQGNGGEWRG